MEATAGKRSAHEALELEQTTLLDDMAVVMPPAEKRPKLLDAELPDVDDDEDFPTEDSELAAANGADAIDMEELEAQQQEREGESEDDDVADVDLDLAELAPPAESSGGLENGNDDAEEEDDEGNEDEDEDEQQHGSETERANEAAAALLNVQEDESEEDDDELDIVDVGGSESAGDDLARPEIEDENEEEEDEDDEEDEVMTRRNANAHEARALLEQLDQSARSKLCLVALEKYGEELFFGHEPARDAILIDACGQDSILSLVREAVRVQGLYARGTSTEPVELDDDEESDDEEDEDNDRDEDDDDDDGIYLISEEETDNPASQETDEHENGNDDDDEEDDDDDAPTEEEDAEPSNISDHNEEVRTDG